MNKLRRFGTSLILALLCSMCFGVGYFLRLPIFVMGQSEASAASNQAPQPSLNAPIPAGANIFVALAKKVVPSVVNISTVSIAKSSNSGGRGGGTQDDLFRKFFEDFFRQHGGGNGGGRGVPNDDDDEIPPSPGPGDKGKPRTMSLGTGFVIDASGLILTNNHVVADADEIKIHFTEETDEKATDGEVVGRDPELDLALIRVKSKRNLVPLALGNSDLLEVGEYVVAVGNPFGQGHSVTHGIISAKERSAPDFVLAKYLQTDAPINPGNSGGPLVNLKGEVIGINNAIDQRAQGIGFAIPIDQVKEVLPQLKSKGSVARGYIGVLVNPLTPEVAAKIGAPKDAAGPFVTHVYPGEPADKAGLKPYDIILDFNGHPIKSPDELVRAVTTVPVNESVPVRVLRNGKEVKLTIKVSQRPGGDEQEKADKEKTKKKKEKTKSRPDVGMELDDLTPEAANDLGVAKGTKGAVVVSVTYGGAADMAGLLRGDVIVEADRKAVTDEESFFNIVKDRKSYLLRVRRADPQGREAFTVIVLELK